MANKPIIPDRSRVLRLGYKLRWFYLGLVVFGWLVWWARYFGQTGWLFWTDNWDVFEPSEYANPVLRVMDLAYFYWAGIEAGSNNSIDVIDVGFSSGSGMQWIWGFSTPWVWSQIMNGGAVWGVVGLGFGLGSLLVMSLSVVGFVGISQRAYRELPAIKSLGYLSQWIAIFAMSMVMAAGFLLALDWLGAIGLWSQYANDLSPYSGGWSFYRESVFVGIMKWPIHPVWLFVPTVFLSWWLLGKQVHSGDRYWRMEKASFMVLLVSSFLLAISIGLWFTDAAFTMVDYWGIHVLRTTTFCSSTAMLWAASCRVWLLFRLVKYEKQRTVMMTESPVCFACEYDLSGSLRGGATRCPECGVGVPAEVIERFGRGGSGGEGLTQEATGL